MTAPKVEPGRIGILDQLAVLPPAVRIGSGLLMLAMGVTGVVMIPASFWSLALLGLALMLGIPLLFGGILAQRRERIETAERARAESELSELRPAIAAAVEQRHNVGRLENAWDIQPVTPLPLQSERVKAAKKHIRETRARKCCNKINK